MCKCESMCVNVCEFKSVCMCVWEYASSGYVCETMYVSVHMCENMYASVCKWARVPMEARNWRYGWSWVTGRVRGMELSSSTRTVHALNH